ncbi:MAG TPA: alpha-amylase family protein [Terriglobia bacterium]|nr:alpha-amylase family protein [Terriglobia bacterium]
MDWSRREIMKLFPGIAAWRWLPDLSQKRSGGPADAAVPPAAGLESSTAFPARDPGQSYPELGYKIYILDFQNSDLDPDTLKDIDAEKLGEAVAKMGADSALVYANNVFGLTFFESKYAPKLKNVPDNFLGQWLEALRKRNIKTVLYHAVYWQEYLAVHHPDWCVLTAEGKPMKFSVGPPEAVVTFLCLNSPFRQYYMKQVKEIADRYSFDSWFVDEFFFGQGMVCYNPHCVAKWKARTGKDLPRPLPDEMFPEYLDFMQDTFHSFYQEIKDQLKASGRTVVTTHNLAMDYALDDYLVRETNPQGIDYYDTSVRTKMIRAYARGREFQMIPHRGNAYLDFANAPLARITWQSAVIASHNSATMWADLGNVNGTIDPVGIQTVKKGFQVIDRIIPKVRGTVPYAETAILVYERDQTITGDGYQDFYGANKLLTDMHWPFDVTTETELLKPGLERYRLLIVPTVQHLPSAQTEAVLQYVENGGNLFFCGPCALYDEEGKPHPSSHFGLVEIAEETRQPRAYVKTMFPIDDERLVAADITTLAPDAGHRVLGTYIRPSVYRSSNSPFIDSPYPGRPTNLPVLVTGKKGKGQFAYAGYRFFVEYLKQDLPVFAQAMNHLVADFYQPDVIVEAPRAVEAIYNQLGSELRISLVNSVTGRPSGTGMFPHSERPGFNNIIEIIPIHDIKISLKAKRVCRATNLNGKELPVSSLQGRTVVTVPRLEQYDVITLELA